MSSPIRTIVIGSILAVSAAYSMPVEKNRVFPTVFRNASTMVTAPLSAQRLAKSAALAWKKTGATVFINSGTDSNPAWEFSSRDTIIYDPSGNVILEMSSTAQSGWRPDSLSSLDSTIYANGKIVETIRKSFSRGYDGSINTFGNRVTTACLNNNKTLMSVFYLWDDSKKTWEPGSKDSVTFSAPTNEASEISDLTNLTSIHAWNYDTAANAWISTGSATRVDAECTTTKLVISGNGQMEENGPFVAFKQSYIYNSSVWTANNLIGLLVQQKYTSTGDFVNVHKTTVEINTSGYMISTESSNWDTLTSAWISSYKSVHVPDAHGNDTLHFWADFDTAASVWDTNSRSRYQRTYDANGNNTQTITTSYEGYDGTWSITEKTINTFAQINQSVRFTVKPTVNQNITIRVSPASVTFAGRNIEALDLFNAAGRPVLSVKQKPAATLQINSARSSIPAGVYIAQIRTSSGKTSLRLPLCR